MQLALLGFIGTDIKQVTITTQSLTNKTVQQHQLNIGQWGYDGSQQNMLLTLGIVPYFPNIPTVIRSVHPGSPAEVAGLKQGDKVLAVDGHTVAGWEEVVNYIFEYANQTLPFKVQRQNKTLVIPVKLGSKTLPSGKVVGFLGVSSQPVPWPKELIRKRTIWSIKSTANCDQKNLANNSIDV